MSYQLKMMQSAGETMRHGSPNRHKGKKPSLHGQNVVSIEVNEMPHMMRNALVFNPQVNDSNLESSDPFYSNDGLFSKGNTS